MFESKSGVLLIGGIGFFLFAFLSNALVPILLYDDMKEKTVEQLVAENQNLMYQVEDLSIRYPETFQEHYGEANQETAAQMLRLGRKIYIGEGCWHCHSQFIRPVSNEESRWGKVASSDEYQNELQRPVMFGTRRVGPDLSREGGRRGNDWHAVHFLNPPDLSTGSPMPKYPWFFQGLSDEGLIARLGQRDPQLEEKLIGEFGADLAANKSDVLAAIYEAHPEWRSERTLSADAPNKRGLAIIAYVQWLGSWLEQYPDYEKYVPVDVEMQNPLE